VAVRAADVLSGDDSRLHFIGRHAVKAGETSFDWVGSGFVMRVSGEGNMTVEMNANGPERFGAFVQKKDGPRAQVADFFSSAGRKNYSIALSNEGDALVHFQKTSEDRPVYLGGKGPASLYAITLGGTLQAVPLIPGDVSPRRIDFYGDSDSASYGVDGTAGASECSGMASFKEENFAHGWITNVAQQLSDTNIPVDMHVQAVSGIGIYENAMGGAASASTFVTLPKLIKRTLQSVDKDDHKGGEWQPHVVVIYAGGNDYANLVPPSEKEFSSAYEAMARDIVGTVGWTSPPAVIHICGGEKIPCDYIKAVSDKLASDAVLKIKSVYTTTGDTGIKKGGCGGHRNTTQQAALANHLAPIISSAAGWN